MLNVARGPLIVEEDLQAALDSGKVGGAALDVFRSEPVTDHPLFGYPNVIVTPHLGASTAEATDRAGYQAAEQVVAALTGGGVTRRSTCRPSPPRTSRSSGRSCRSAARSAGSSPRSPRAARSTASRSSTSAGSPTATRRPLTIAVLLGVLHGKTEEERQRGQRARDRVRARHRGRRDQAHERARLHRPRARDARQRRERERVVGTTLGRRHRPHLLEAWGAALQPPARGPRWRCSSTATSPA